MEISASVAVREPIMADLGDDDERVLALLNVLTIAVAECPGCQSRRSRRSGTRLKGAKYGPSCGAPVNVMQSAKYRLCDDLAAGLPRPKMRHSRIVGRTLAK
jgi:hypothetical protein